MKVNTTTIVGLKQTKRNTTVSAVEKDFFNQEQVQVIKKNLCPGIDDYEIKIFAHACKKTGLDPFMKQIYAVKMWNSAAKREIMTILIGIDGYRSIAERTGRYAPNGRRTEFEYEKNDVLKSATEFVKMMTPDGTWHEVVGTASLKEYTKKNDFWRNKPRIMLSKCAESIALRKAFPVALSGTYTVEEMSQEDVVEGGILHKEKNIVSLEEIPHKETNTVSLSHDEIKEVKDLIGDDKERMDKVLDHIENRFKVSKIEYLTKNEKETLCNGLKKANARKLEEKIA